MRIAGLFTLALLLPTFVYAAGLVNINTANATLLDTLPGIGPSKATAIIDYRIKNGPFATVADIQKVKGIGPATFVNLEKLITVDMVSATPVASPTPPSTPTDKQPSPTPESYKKVQDVEPAPSTNVSDTVHEITAVGAPAAATEVAAAGATLPPATSLFKSPWIFGLIGVIVVASGAFILL